MCLERPSPSKALPHSSGCMGTLMLAGGRDGAGRSKSWQRARQSQGCVWNPYSFSGGMLHTVPTCPAGFSPLPPPPLAGTSPSSWHSDRFCWSEREEWAEFVYPSRTCGSNESSRQETAEEPGSDGRQPQQGAESTSCTLEGPLFSGNHCGKFCPPRVRLWLSRKLTGTRGWARAEGQRGHSTVKETSAHTLQRVGSGALRKERCWS